MPQRAGVDDRSRGSVLDSSGLCAGKRSQVVAGTLASQSGQSPAAHQT